MGLTLTRSARWTSVEGNKGKLDYSPINEHIINEITQFILEFPAKSPHESKLIFKKPLEWTSENLTLSHFTGQSFTTDPDGTVRSQEKAPNGESVLIIKKAGKNATLRALSVQQLSIVLQVAKEKRLMETKYCLENNPEPVVKMLGDAYATIDGNKDNTMNRLLDKALKSDAKEEERYALKIYMDIDQLDKHMLSESLKKLTNEIRITPLAINEEIKLLQSYSGNDPSKHVLKTINHISDVEFNNGCRAPTWRQLQGDITYLRILPFNQDQLTVTCNRNGVYLNRNIVADNDEKNNYEKVGETYKDLVSFLKEKSQVFKENITKIDFKLFHHENSQNMEHYGLSHTEAAKQKQYYDDLEDKHKHQQQQENLDLYRNVRLEETRDWSNISNIKELKNFIEKDKQKMLLSSQHHDSSLKKSSRTSHLHSAKSSSVMASSRAQLITAANGDTSGESSPDTDEEDELAERGRQDQSDLPSEYWQIQKLVKYLKGGNQTATIIALCSMRDFNLALEACQFAIRDVGGLEVLINLLDTEDIKCKIGSLQILKEISKNAYIRRSIADLGGLQVMVKILTESDKDLKCLAAETIAHVAKFKRARTVVRQNNGIKRLVALLDSVKPQTHHIAQSQLELSKDIEVARCGALALWSLSKSKRNKHEMRRSGVIPLLASLLKSTHESMCIPIVGTLQECASEPSYRLAIRTEGMVEDLVKNLKSSNQELQMHCANAIFKCAEDKETRDLIRKYDGLDPLVSLLSNRDNKPLLAAATGAIWKCSISKENVKRFQELKTIESLVALLGDPTEEVLINTVGALAECAQEPDNRVSIRKSGGVSPLVYLLTSTNNQLLVNTCKALGQSAQDSDNIQIIERMEGIRLLWSLLKNPSPRVQAAAAWAICPCIKNVKDSGEIVRNFVGGLELIVSLLKSHDIEVLASVCAATAEIAKDEENLAVITDHGVVPMLASLTNTTDDTLRRYLTEAIAQCCKWGKNRELFGRNNAVAPLVKYLRSPNQDVHTSTAKALHQLSKNPDNCITMHENGVVRLLIGMVGSGDEVLQENAAGCISYIRRLALANEKYHHA